MKTQRNDNRLNLDVRTFRNGRKAMVFVLGLIAAASGNLKQVVAQIVAIAFHPNGSVCLVVNETALTVTEKRATYGLFTLPLGYVTMRYLTVSALATFLEIPRAALNFLGVKQFVEEIGTVLLNSNGDLHLIADPLYTYGVYASEPKSKTGTYAGITLPGGITAEHLRVVGKSGLLIAGVVNSGSVWTGNLKAGLDQITDGRAWNDRSIVIFADQTIRGFTRPTADGTLIAIGSNGTMREMKTVNATPTNTNAITLGSEVQYDGAITPQAYLASGNGRDAGLFAGAWDVSIVGGKNAFGFGIVPVEGMNAVEIAAAFAKAPTTVAVA